MNGVIAGMLLPTPNRDVDIAWIDFDAMTNAANPLCRDQGGAGTEKSIEDNLSAGRAVEQGIGYQRDGLHGRMQGKKIAFLGLSGERVYRWDIPKRSCDSDRICPAARCFAVVLCRSGTQRPIHDATGKKSPARRYP